MRLRKSDAIGYQLPRNCEVSQMMNLEAQLRMLRRIQALGHGIGYGILLQSSTDLRTYMDECIFNQEVHNGSVIVQSCHTLIVANDICPANVG